MKQEEIKFKGFKTYYSTKFIITEEEHEELLENEEY